MRRVFSMLLVACGLWAQQPQKADPPLTSGSLSVSGLRNEKVLTSLFVGDFAHIPFGRGNLSFVALFQDYLESYGRHCDRYLPANKIELTRTVCAVEETKIDRYGSRVQTGNCLSYRTEGMGIFADPVLYAAKGKLDDDAGPGMIQDAFQTMKQQNPLEAALNTLNETQQMGGDMEQLFRLNSCTSPGIKRLQENIALFSAGKPAIVLPGAVASVTPRSAPSGPFKDSNYARLLEDLIADQSRSWLMNRFVIGSTTDVVVSSRDSAGRPEKVVGKYLFNGRSQGSVTVSFTDGLPQCMYFFDFPATCKTPSPRIVGAYSSGSYQSPEAGSNPRSPATATSPVPPAAPRQLPQPPATAVAAPKSVPPATPAKTPAPVAPPPTPAQTVEQQREKQRADNQKRVERITACQATYQQQLKDRPDNSVEFTKAYTACLQAASQPSTGPAR